MAASVASCCFLFAPPSVAFVAYDAPSSPSSPCCPCRVGRADSTPVLLSCSALRQREWRVHCLPDGSAESEKVPEWAKPGTDALPPWALKEKVKTKEEAQDLPFFVYLIASSLVAIAAVGSVFEYVNKNAVFGIVDPDSPLYAPILGFFAITGLPTAGYLWYKSISLANKASEAQDKEDGFL